MELLTIKEASKLMKRSEATVRSYLENGTLTKYLVFIHSIRIDKAEAEKLMKGRVEKTIPGGV